MNKLSLVLLFLIVIYVFTKNHQVVRDETLSEVLELTQASSSDYDSCYSDLWVNARKPQRNYNFWAECKMGPSYHGNHNRNIPVQLDADYDFPYFNNMKYQPNFDYSSLS